MIFLPASPGAAAVEPAFVDTGIYQRGGGGATIDRIDKPGTHMAATFTYPPMFASVSKVFEARLMRAKSGGITVKWPLLDVDQSGLGSAPTVDGVLSAGTQLLVKGLTPGALIDEGFWLSVIDPAGFSYFHKVGAAVNASAGGKAGVAVWPPLRSVFADGNPVALAVPVIAGALVSEVKWALPKERLIVHSFTVEEQR